MKNQFKAGVAYEIITPPLGTPLYGYEFQRKAEKVNDDLRSTAIAVEQGDLKAILISADVVSIGADLANRVRTLIAEATDVPFKNISISAIHTHSGPAMKSAKGWGNANESFINDIFIPKTVKAAKTAVENLTPAVMGVGTTRSEVGVNRREMLQNGTVILGQNPYGICDLEMTVVSFRSLDGTPVANIVHYSAHGTAAGRNPEITRDWPGVMIDRMEKETGAVTLFFNGSEGDMGPRLSNGQTTGDVADWTKTDVPTGDIRYVYEIGCVAAIDAMRAYNSIKDYSEVQFKAESDVLTLPYDKQWSLEEAKKRLAQLDAKEHLVQVENREYAKVSAIIDMYNRNEPFKTHMSIDQTIFSFNSVAFVPFCFELFSEVALRLRKYSPFANTLCMCNTNGSEFYLPSKDQFVRGGYEIDIFRLANVYKLTDDTDTVIINENMKILKRMNPYTIKEKERYTHG